jgi:hypothetical protein
MLEERLFATAANRLSPSMRSTLAVLTSDIFNIGSRPDVAVARSADIDGSREVVAMPNIAHSVLVLGTTLLSLRILLFGGYVN